MNEQADANGKCAEPHLLRTSARPAGDEIEAGAEAMRKGVERRIRFSAGEERTIGSLVGGSAVRDWESHRSGLTSIRRCRVCSRA